MSLRTPTRRPSIAGRRFGYLVAATVNLVLLYLVHEGPGWQAVPFLTADTRRVLGPVTLSLVAGVVVNLLYVVRDPKWLRAIGDAGTAAIALVVLIRIWQVFPFDFGDATFDWALLTRSLLVVGVVGSAIGVGAGLWSLLRELVHSAAERTSDSYEDR